MNENSGHYYTNQELYQLFDPMNPELPYLYDNFDWGHCHTAAYFPTLLLKWPF